MKISKQNKFVNEFINKIDKSHIDKLKELGLFDKYIKNLVHIYGNDLKEMPENFSYNILYTKNFDDFIDRSFLWVKTFEGGDFWKDVSLK